VAAESYFAELLDREPRAPAVLDRFVIADGARTATAWRWNTRCTATWRLAQAQRAAAGALLCGREIAGILAVLDALHRARRCTAT